MHGKLFREWVLFLKEKKMYSRFVIHYRAADISARTWGREKPSFKLLNGADCIMANKSDSLEFGSFLSSMRTIDWHCPIHKSFYWTSIATDFGELKGYIKPRNDDNDNYWSITFEDNKSSTSYTVSTSASYSRRRNETYGKWYDKFYINPIKNHYRR
jgi:hypothetical protein